MNASSTPPPAGIALDRYLLGDKLAEGGMAAVHIGRQLGAKGFARLVAVKRMHARLAEEPEFVSMFVDEARLAARVRHPNVVQTLDVVERGDELLLVMDYVPGESLARLEKAAWSAGERVPPEVAAAIVIGILHGLEAAHVAVAEDGAPLGIVHRDVSPQNVLVGADGVPRLLDFGIAKANVRLTTTREGQLKGKLGYMAPEQIRGGEVTARADVYATGVVLWELFAGRRAFANAPNEGYILAAILEGSMPSLGDVAPDIHPSLVALVSRAMAKDPRSRFPSAREMALALEAVVSPAPPRVVGDWVRAFAKDTLARQAAMAARVERSWSPSVSPPALAPRPIAAAAPETTVDAAPGAPRFGDFAVPDTTVDARPRDPFELPEATQTVVTPPARSKLFPWVAAAGLLAGGAAALLLAVPGRGGAGTAPSSSVPVVDTALPRASVADTAPPSVPVADTASPSAPVADTTPPSVPVAETAPPRPSPSGAARVPAAKPSAKPKGRCDPPYVTGPDGIRVPKRECLGN